MDEYQKKELKYKSQAILWCFCVCVFSVAQNWLSAWLCPQSNYNIVYTYI